MQVTLLFSNGSKPLRKLLKGVKRRVGVSILCLLDYTYIIEKKKGFCKPFFYLRYNNDLNDRLYTSYGVFYGDCL